MDGVADQKLPGIITSVTTQKNNRERYSVFVDDTFLLGVAESTLIKFKLSKGVEITPSLFRRLQREEDYFAVKAYALKLLGNREHARRELCEKALRKGYPAETVHQVLDDLTDKDWIDDRRFAEKFAAGKQRLNNWGPVKIRAHLIKKGIDRDVIRHTLQQVFENQNLRDTFVHLVSKRKRRFLREEDPLKRKRKNFDYLCRKGYRPEQINSYLDELTKTVDS